MSHGAPRLAETVFCSLQVIPAQRSESGDPGKRRWFPAFAGMTSRGVVALGTAIAILLITVLNRYRSQKYKKLKEKHFHDNHG